MALALLCRFLWYVFFNCHQ